MATIVIQAPEDGFVSEIAKDGAVNSGQRIVALRCPKLDRFASNLTALEELIAIRERPLNDGRADEVRSLTMQKVQALKQAADASNTIYQDLMTEQKEGQLSLDTVKSWDFDRQQATSVYLDAQIAASQAEKNKSDSLDKISAAKKKLDGDRAYLAAMQAALIIQSPEDGNFSARVAVSGFLKKGQIVGEIVVSPIGQAIPYSSLLLTTGGKRPAFVFNAFFTLGASSTGINPPAQPVTLHVGPYSATMPAGSFRQVASEQIAQALTLLSATIPGGSGFLSPLASGPSVTAWAFNGKLDNVSLAIDILSLGHDSYQFGVAAEPVDLTAVANPVPVSYSIGNNEGVAAVTATLLP